MSKELKIDTWGYSARMMANDLKPFLAQFVTNEFQLNAVAKQLEEQIEMLIDTHGDPTPTNKDSNK